jgi:hypothetical protein
MLSISLLTISLLPAFLPPEGLAQGQSPKALSTQIEITSTPPDITFVQGKSYISGTGDFNGDRIDDFLITYWLGGQGNIANIKYGIIFGKNNLTSPITIDLSSGQPDLALRFKQGENPAYGELGSFGDLNGDGIAELFFQEFRANSTDQEALAIFYGSSNWRTGEIELSPARADLKLLFPYQTYLAGLADLNGDASKDLVFASRNNDTPPDNPIFLGPFARGETIDPGQRAPDVVIYGFAAFFFADLNGDRLQDIVAQTSKPIAGESLYAIKLNVIYGRSDFRKGETRSISVDQADAVLSLGTEAPVRFATGDLNKDGNDDIVIGHPDRWGVANPPWYPGRVDIIFGSPALRGQVTPTAIRILGLPPPLYPIPGGSSLTDGFGDAVEVRDINHDGIADLLITSMGFTVNDRGEVRQTGRVNVVLGSEGLANESVVETGNFEQDITITSSSESKIIGFAVRSGDFNGDGFADILAASRFDTVAENSTPATLLYFGGPLRAPELSEAQYSKSEAQLSIFGKELTGSARVQINGQIVDREVLFDAGQNRLLVQGSVDELNLHTGKNKIVVIRKGVPSNTIKFKLKASA